jgi:hybrid polyketide synthase/nonribosomal peptide synthetase ACE1
LSSQEIPYTGLSARDKNAAESFADGLGYVWTYLGKNSVKIPGYDKLLTGRSSFNLVKGLPAYSWDHEKEYWHEFRYTRAIRTRSDPVHELLGHLTPDTTDQEMRWRNILSPKEVPWLEGHALQHQTVFPAAGYVVTALEAAVAMCKGASSSLIEILDLDIGKALTFESGDSRVETLFSLSDITRHDGKTIDALFKYYATATKQGDTLDLLASGHVRVTLGDYCSDAHPVRGPREPNLLKVDTDNFYSSLLELEYQYTGPFRALSALERKLGFATGFIDNEQPSKLLVHPAVLDAAFQSVLLAQSAPGSGGIWSLHVPKTIQSVRFNPHLCAVEMSKTTPVAFDCTQPADINAMAGDVDLFADGSEFAMLHVEGLHCVPFSRATAKEDKELFATTIWDVAIPDAERIAYDGEPTSEQLKL